MPKDYLLTKRIIVCPGSPLVDIRGEVLDGPGTLHVDVREGALRGRQVIVTGRSLLHIDKINGTVTPMKK